MQFRDLITVTVCASLLLAVLPPPAQADHKPTSYCSETGDICQSVRKVDGVRKLKIVMTAKYFGRFYLCVLPSKLELQECRKFRVKAWDDGLYGRSVPWPRKWDLSDKGAYTVKWRRVQEQPWPGPVIGKALGFHAK